MTDTQTMGEGLPRSRRLETAAFLFVMTCPFVAFVQLMQPRIAWAVALVVALVLVVVLMRRRSELAPHAAFWTVFLAGLVSGVPWPLSFVLPFLPLFIAARFSTSVRKATSWLRRGTLDRGTLLLMLPIIVGSSGGLVAWFVFFAPDISATTQGLPAMRPEVFAAAALAFSILNACWEELLLKGMMWEGLSLVLPAGVAVNVVQSFFFGLVHYHGFPHGIAGVVMAAIYGYAIGMIRQQSRGMLAPIVTHVFADLTISALVYARWKGIL